LTGDPRNLESHFAFGENWQSFVSTITPGSIAEAERGLSRLLSETDIEGKSFLDIGCGSGLSMLAAARLGARSVEGVDIDPRSVAAAQALLTHHAPGVAWEVRAGSVFELGPERDGVFDIVHSWGVLHHTGDMDTAVRRAAALVRPDGLLVLALYRRTPLCGFWQREKRLYAHSGTTTQALLRAAYKTAYCMGLLATGRNPISYARSYKTRRGMDWSHDVHDWLGGYPYESIAPDDVRRLLDELGFRLLRSFEKPAAIKGLLGSHCDEYVAVRQSL
jgi:2-polyprenyl-6-hydroxyphenyl methylase/3-demethylubiquinone-9 3-methyltransferase